MILQTLNPTVELVTPIGTETKEANAETEMEPAIVEAGIIMCST